MDFSEVTLAEREASEVLHSLLSVERIEKPSISGADSNSNQWHTPVQPNLEINLDFYGHDYVGTSGWSMDDETARPIMSAPHPCREGKGSQKRGRGHLKKTVRKRISEEGRVNEFEDTSAETNPGEDGGIVEVKQRFRLGCECGEPQESCFRGLDPEAVHRHRLNIAELTKEERDMYLMGVTMACLSQPTDTVKQRERQRLRSQYVYQGRKVCLSAFVFLENCTLYHIKRIRKHLIEHGVTPRVHGNHGKKPHNVFSLDVYRQTTNFLREYLKQWSSSSQQGNSKSTVVLPPHITRKEIHKAYKESVLKMNDPHQKIMGYSTFRHFMKEQFRQVKFSKIDFGNTGSGIASKSLNSSKTHRAESKSKEIKAPDSESRRPLGTRLTKEELSRIPVVIASSDEDQVKMSPVRPAYIFTPSPEQVEVPSIPPSYILTPVQPLIQNHYNFISHNPASAIHCFQVT